MTVYLGRNPVGLNIVRRRNIVVDEYYNVVQIENTMRGTNEMENDVVATACNHISQFLYGVDNQ
jgi:hypothetical protein